MSRALPSPRQAAAVGARMLDLERRHWERGTTLVAGVDEAGMGSLAGPVVAAAVVLDPARPVREARDSKQLDASSRVALDVRIRAEALAVGVGLATLEEIATLNVYHAGLLAMRRAVDQLDPAAQVLLVDARTVPDVTVQQEAHVKGDARSCSIASASIVAKVHRDALMARLAESHPGYGFEQHAGYATPVHLAALRRLGPCPVHRDAWAALAEHSGGWSPGYYRLREDLDTVTTARGLAGWNRCLRDVLPNLSQDEVRKLHLVMRRRGLAPPPRPRRGRVPSSALPFD